MLGSSPCLCVQAKHDGMHVMVRGALHPEELHDEEFNLRYSGVFLRRSIEMYQWAKVRDNVPKPSRSHQASHGIAPGESFAFGSRYGGSACTLFSWSLEMLCGGTKRRRPTLPVQYFC